jgi:coenzyme F420-reducing hydrogenase beta subunit
MRTLEQKGESIIETVENIREKNREVEKRLQELLRIAVYYLRGIDPQDIEKPVFKQDGIAIITLKDGSVHRIPVKELEP